MKTFILTLLLIVIIICPLNATDFPEIKGWKPVSEVMTYNPENLYEYINGAADQFLDYGFRLLHSRDLSQNDLTITVDIYDLGSQLNAFGMYKTERPLYQEGLSIGTEAIISPPYQCLLLKDVYYVKVNVFEGEMIEKTIKALLEAIATALPGKIGSPEALKLLPSSGKFPGSEGYTRIGFLGLTELSNCIHAKYTDESEKEFQYFVILPFDNVPKETIWEKLAEKWKKLESKKHHLLVKKIPYKGTSGIMLTEEKIIGVTDCADESEVINRLEAVVSQ